MNTLELFKNDQDQIRYQAGDIVFSQGEPGDSMYVVKEGEVEVLVGDKVVDTAVPGGILGEMALIDSNARSATARAKTECSLIPINERRFRFLVQQTPFFSIYVMRILVDRLRKMNEIVAG